jgi:DNA replication protein DnaC
MLLKLPGNPPGIRLLTEEESGKLRAVHPSLPTPENCITCEGRRTFRWWSHAAEGWNPDDGSSIEDFECPCIEQYKLHRFMLHCNIGLLYQRLNWNDVEADPSKVEVVHEWLRDSPAYIQAGVGLILRGTPGTGKTLLGALLLKGLIAQGRDVYFTTFNEMLDFFSSTWRDNDEKKWFSKRVKNAAVVMVDDPGKESGERRGSGMPIAAMDEVLRHRIAASRPTIITTNDSKEKFTLRYGEYIASLLTERSASIRLEGSDYRERARARVLDEVKQKLTRPLVLR